MQHRQRGKLRGEHQVNGLKLRRFRILRRQRHAESREHQCSQLNQEPNKQRPDENVSFVNAVSRS